MKKVFFTIFGVLIFCGLFAQEIPQKISYQGKLLEDGYAVTGTKNFTFTIGAWSESHSSVQVTNGLYSVTLGKTTPIPTSIFNNSSSVSLQIKVEGTTLSPTTEILSVPYAYKAEKAVDAEKIAGRTVSTTTPSTNQVLKWNGSLWTPQADDNDGLTLPYVGVYNGSGTAFHLEPHGNGAGIVVYHDGITGNGINIVHFANGQGMMISKENGHGSALYIAQAGSDGHGIEIQQDAPGDGIYIYNNGVGDAIYTTTVSTGYAGYFDGDVVVTGNLSWGSSSLKIDHPLDPDNKYLYHSFVESPDMMNVYNGNIALDNNGEAIVELPEWFEIL